MDKRAEKAKANLKDKLAIAMTANPIQPTSPKWLEMEKQYKQRKAQLVKL